MAKKIRVKPQEDKIKAAVEFIETYYNQPIKVGDIAYEAGLSAGRLCHLFKERMGLSPIEYLTNVRIAQAEKLLLNTDDKLCNLYYEVGFNSQAYFTRKFKEVVGISPAQFRALAYWDKNNTSIKWVLVDFQADVPANGSTTYYLKDGGTGNAAGTALSVTDTAEAVNVDTGAAAFKMSKTAFNLFDYVKVGDAELIQSGHGGGVSLIKGGTEYKSALSTPTAVEIEESGPMRVVVKVKGKHKSSGGSEFFAPWA